MAAAPKRDYYEVLGVARDSGPGAIKDAFRKLALEYHPDRNKAPQAQERFKEIAEAYAVLCDPRKRSEYDARGFAGVPLDDLFGPGGFESVFGDLGFGERIFERFFGGRRRGPPRGEDIRVEAPMPLERIARGGEETIRYARLAACGACKGSGAKAGTSPRSCSTCGGSGQKLSERLERGVHIREASTCPDCHGRGTLIDERCPACGGSGSTRLDESLAVQIPVGAEEGLVLRIPGKGQAHPGGGVPGDLLIVLRARPDARFERHGADLWRAQAVEVADAVLGTEISVPTLEAPVTVTVPAGTQPGAVLRLRGKGLPRFGGRGHGDLYLRFDVALPATVGADERELWEELRALRAGAPMPGTFRSARGRRAARR